MSNINFQFWEEPVVSATPIQAALIPGPAVGVNGNGRGVNRLITNAARLEGGLVVSECASAPLDVYGFAIYSGSELKLNGTPIRTGATDVESLRLSVLPSCKLDRLRVADGYYESDDYLGSVLDVKRDFSCLGFNLTYTVMKAEEAKLLRMTDEELDAYDTKELETQAQIEDYLTQLSQEWNLPSIVSDLFLRLYITDSFILYWRTDKGTRPGRETLKGVWQILSMNPKDCEWENDQGQDRLVYHIPMPLQNRIREADRIGYGANAKEERAAKLQALLDDGIPQEWIDSVLQGDCTVEMKREDGHNWIIYTNGPEQNGLTDPSMYRIFLFLECRRALRDGDFTASYLMKHFIQHVTLGESMNATSYNLSNLRATWATEKEINAMHDIVRIGTRSCRLVTNHTVKIHYVYPPKEMFDGAKYQKPEDMILQWAHWLKVLMTGNDGTNSSGYLGLKAVDAHLSFSRERVCEAIIKFFRILRKDKTFQELPDKYLISCSFDRNALKEPKQVLDELKFFVDVNVMAPETALRETGRNAQQVLLEKRRANILSRKTNIYQPIVVRSSQISSGNSGPATLQTTRNQDDRQDSGGRPPNAGTTPNEGTRTQSPPAAS